MTMDDDTLLVTLARWVETLDGPPSGAELVAAGLAGSSSVGFIAFDPDRPDAFVRTIVDKARVACDLRGVTTTFELVVGNTRLPFTLAPASGSGAGNEGPDPAGLVGQCMRFLEAQQRQLAEYAELGLRREQLLLERLRLLEQERTQVLEQERTALQIQLAAERDLEEVERRLAAGAEGEDDPEYAQAKRRTELVASGASMVLRDLGVSEKTLTDIGASVLGRLTEKNPEAAAKLVQLAMQPKGGEAA